MTTVTEGYMSYMHARATFIYSVGVPSLPWHGEVWPAATHALLLAKATCLHHRDGFRGPSNAAVHCVLNHRVVGVVDDSLLDGVSESAVDDEIMRGAKRRGCWGGTA